jgi:hypothetical protein
MQPPSACVRVGAIQGSALCVRTWAASRLFAYRRSTTHSGSLRPSAIGHLNLALISYARA